MVQRAPNPLEPAALPAQPLAAASHAASDTTAQRTLQRAPNPLDPVAAAPLAATPLAAAPGAAPRPRRITNPLEAPAQWPAAAVPEIIAEPKRSRAPLIYAVAAISCAAAIALWFYFGSSDPARGKAAMGALQEAANVQAANVAGSDEPAQNQFLTGSEPTHTPTPVQPVAASAVMDPSLAPTPSRAARTDVTAPRSGATPAAEPGSPQALVDEGMKLAQQGRLGLAESSYQKALQLSPEFPTAIAGLVRVHLTRRDGAEAVRWAKRLVAKQPNGANQLLLGDAQALYGDEDAARAAWTLAADSGNNIARQRLR
jgi:tetratricopeptide (TPR) repeat protein